MSESHHANHHHKHDIDDRQLQNDTKSGKLTDGQTSSHMTALYKGLVALMGMYGFFFLERCFTHFTQHRGRKTKSKSLRKTSCNEEVIIKHFYFLQKQNKQIFLEWCASFLSAKMKKVEYHFSSFYKAAFVRHRCILYQVARTRYGLL